VGKLEEVLAASLRVHDGDEIESLNGKNS